MEDLNTQLKTLQNALQLLIKQYKHLQKDNESLRSANEILNKKLLQKDALLQNEQQKQAAENLALLQTDEEKQFLRLKIDGYLKDVEKCLSLLNA